MVRRMATQSDMQSATFKSIRSVQPLLDRVLVQRFKAETVSALYAPLLALCKPSLDSLELCGRLGWAVG